MSQIKSTEIQADNIAQLHELMKSLHDITSKWCLNHKNYTYDLKHNVKDLTIKLTIEKQG